MRGALIITGVIVATIAVALWTPIGWRREGIRNARSPSRWFRRALGIDVIRQLPAGRAYDYSGADADALIRQFGPESDKARSVKQHLDSDRRALLFQGDNSVMLVFFDRQSRALQAECFL